MNSYNKYEDANSVPTITKLAVKTIIKEDTTGRVMLDYARGDRKVKTLRMKPQEYRKRMDLELKKLAAYRLRKAQKQQKQPSQ